MLLFTWSLFCRYFSLTSTKKKQKKIICNKNKIKTKNKGEATQRQNNKENEIKIKEKWNEWKKEEKEEEESCHNNSCIAFTQAHSLVQNANKIRNIKIKHSKNLIRKIGKPNWTM